MRFEKLCEPYQIKGVKLRNRIVKPGQVMNYADDGDYVSERNKAFYEVLARGGVGLIIVESTCVDTPIGISGSMMPRMSIDDDKFIPRLAELAEVIHKHGCPAFLQMSHAGPAHPGHLFADQPVSSSSLSVEELPDPKLDVARELSIPEIREIEDKFAKAAERAKRAGFDGIELHGGHRYLINSFLSRAWNKRQDEYGCQDLESRTRFAVEVIQKIRELVGEDFVVGIRYNGGEWGLERGISAEECVEIGMILEKAGIDYLHITGYGYGPYKWITYPEQILYPEPNEDVTHLAKTVKKPGVLIPRAEAVKKAVSVPVIGVGRLGPELGEWLLEQGKVDLVAMGRRLMADPGLPNKVMAGRLEDVRPCLACQGCISDFYEGRPVRCRVNASLGREGEYVLRPVDRKKRVLVVGGGPAGMEAARVEALRGHEVFLYERERKLGGSLPLASLVKGLEVEDLTGLLGYLRTQIRKLGVKVQLNKEVDLDIVSEVKPDVVIVATGAMFTTPEIPGINRPNVVSSSELRRKVRVPLTFLGPRLLGWLTRFWLPVGRRVVIMGGQIHGCQVAEFLVKRGREVTVVDTSNELGTGIVYVNKPRLLDWLVKKGATMLTEVKYDKITNKGLTVVTRRGEKQTVEADTIIVVTPPVPNTEFFKTLEGKVPEVFIVGDCKEARLILDAISDGFRVGYTV